ncbi:MAG: PASTA domain-containing protein [Bacteroidaceae bacterium]|nr:PASTA domain-containing protein [Bacteroidaceae bacterium]
MTFKEFRKKIFSPLIWGNFLAMGLVAMGLVIGLWYFMKDYTHHGESIEVPNVKGMPFHDAEYALQRAGLIAVVADSSYNRTLPAGTILEQLPVSGKLVKSGREIQLTINTSETPTLTVPDIADNCSLREAEAKLKAQGFKIGPVEYIPGDKDWVLGVKCRGRHVMAGERIPIDAPLVLVVGNTAVEGEEEILSEEELNDSTAIGEEAEEIEIAL